MSPQKLEELEGVRLRRVGELSPQELEEVRALDRALARELVENKLFHNVGFDEEEEEDGASVV